MKPSQVLKTYLWVSFLLGIILCLPVAGLLRQREIEPVAGVLLVVLWNTIFMLVLPVVLDWSERKYCNARFLQLEELAAENPELQAFLESQCRRLQVDCIRLAVCDSASADLLSYGLWRYNPRLIVPKGILDSESRQELIPSIELELGRFARQELSLAYFTMIVCQILLELALFGRFG